MGTMYSMQIYPNYFTPRPNELIRALGVLYPGFKRQGKSYKQLYKIYHITMYKRLSHHNETEVDV